MNIFQRVKAAFGLVFRYTIPDWLKTQAGFPYIYGSNDAGEPVSSLNGERITTIFNAINVIAQDIATADIQISRKSQKGVEVLYNDPLERLLDQQPNPYMNAYQFKYVMTFLGESRGESYAWIERDGNYQPIALWPINPNYAEPMKDEFGNRWIQINGVTFPYRDIFCYYTFTLDGFTGESKIVHNAQLIGLKMKTHRYKVNTIGTQVNGFLKGDVNETQATQIAKGWKDKTAKGETPFLFGKDIDYKQLMFTPEQTDIVTSEKWTDTMTLGIFRVQPVMVGNHENSNYSNAEQQSIIHTKYTLNAPKKAWEQEVFSKLISEREKARGKYMRLSLDHLLEGDTATMMQKIQTLTTLGVWSANNVLDALKMPHQEGDEGDKYYIQGAMIEKGKEPTQDGTNMERMMKEIEDVLNKNKLNGHEKGELQSSN